MQTVTVIIPTWNAAPRLRRCLESLHNQTRPPDQIIVIDNGSSDDTCRFIQVDFPQITLISLSENHGPAFAVNQGILEAKGAYVATLDSDAYPTPTWIECLLSALKSHPVFSFAASRLLLADDPTRVDSAGDGFNPFLGGVMIGFGEENTPQFGELREVFSVTSAASFYKHEVFDRVGLMDDSLFMYGEDIDFGFRARLQGFRCLYVPDAVAYHERSATMGRNSPRQIRLMYRNGLTVYMKNMPWPLVRPIFWRVVREWAASLRHAPHRTAALLGIMQAIRRLPKTLSDRRRIQQTRTATVDELIAAMSSLGTMQRGDGSGNGG
jgi:GT2 family glycosyltransferase